MAMANTKHLESMLFNYETTAKTDFRNGEILPPTTTTYKKKGTCVRIRPPPLKDVHTLVDWYVPNVPFSLYHKPKDVVRTNPRDVQQTFLRAEDKGREEAQRTRPQLVMTPAISLDDVEDSKMREGMVADVYYSSAHRAMEEAVRLVMKKPVRAPLPGKPACAKPIYLRCLREPVVPPEWRMETVDWDRQQLRAHVDPEREFWRRFNLYKDCVSCKEFAQVTKMRKLKTGKH